MVGSHEPAGVVVKMVSLELVATHFEKLDSHVSLHVTQGAAAEQRGKLKVGDRVGSINTYHRELRIAAIHSENRH